MTNRVLYFPSIRVPQGEWFARVLLYWDSVATIVPSEYLDDPQFLRPYTASLIECKLLETMTPDANIWNSGAKNNYYPAFLDFVDRHPMLVTGAPLSERVTSRIHTDKTGTGLAEALVDRGLAQGVAGPEWARWFDVEEQTANLLMAYLAAILCRASAHPTAPITDRRECLAAFEQVRGHGAPNNGTAGLVARTEGFRTTLLREILPGPAGIIRPPEIAAFKDRHADLLRRFRTSIELEIVDVAAIDDPELRKEKVELVLKGLAAQKTEITARMEEYRWKHLGFGTLAAVVAGGVAAADALTSGGALTLTASSIGLAGAVYEAFSGSRRPDELLRQPLAYAAFAEREFA
jgi:hypothetical protein